MRDRTTAGRGTLSDMIKTSTTLGFALFLCAGAVMSAQSGTPADESAIRQRLGTYAAARTARDAHAEALCYTEDGDFRSSAGPFVTGRAKIEQQLTVANPNYRFELDVLTVRFLDPQAAVVETDLRTGVSTPLAKLVGTYVMVKRNGEWLISAARIARAMP
jgi:uncharacterized protein (TIGR02246 family)